MTAATEKLASLIRPNRNGSTKILDIGCGFCTPAKILQKSVPNAVVTGLTLSEEQANACTTKGVPAVAADFSTARLSGGYDVAFFQESLFYFRSWQEKLAALRKARD